MVTPARPAGFTLIELMITVAVMGLLLLAGMPFTRAWVDGNRQMRIRNQLLEGIGQARALALRNASGCPAFDAAGNAVGVVRLGVDAAATGMALVQRDCAGGMPGNWVAAPVWSGAFTRPDALQLKPAGRNDYPGLGAFEEDSHVFACVEYDNRGMPVAADDCVEAGKSRVAVGIRAQPLLYVDLQ